MLTDSQLKSHREQVLKRRIILTASKTLINKPKITGFKINEYNGVTYKNAECILTESFTNPITHIKEVNKYKVIYDGVDLIMTELKGE